MSRLWNRFDRSSQARRAATRRRRALHPALETCEPRTLLSGSAVPIGYTPAQIRQAYSFNGISFNSGTVSGNGSGQTIAIVEAYDDPSFVDSTVNGSPNPAFSSSDLALFDRQFGLPDPPSFTKYNESGQTTGLPGTDPAGAGNADGNWEDEEALDIEWAHATAPGASIDLIEANSPFMVLPGPGGNLVASDLLKAVTTAQGLPGVTVVSMSFYQSISGESAFDPYFSHAGVAFVAAAGDQGQFSYPASSPNVLGVAGTSLTLNAAGGYGSESVWITSGGSPTPWVLARTSFRSTRPRPSRWRRASTIRSRTAMV
jgi:subtilase family serine protease